MIRRWTEHHVITVLSEDGVGRYEYDVPMVEIVVDNPGPPPQCVIDFAEALARRDDD